MKIQTLILLLFIAGNSVCAAESAPPDPVPVNDDFYYIDTSFENASPLYWEIDSDGTIQVFLVYDSERSSPNRANGHWHFRIQAKKGADLTVVLNNFDNVWNGKKGSPVSDKTICFASTGGKTWKVLQTEKTDKNQIKIQVHIEGESLYLARLEPYRISDLEALKTEIKSNPLVDIQPIGHTVQGRELEIIRVGNPDAPCRVFLRARAHPWEPGGNWVIQGLIHRLLETDEDAKRYLERYCVYIMPMANKDGVARGATRFNLLGKDLNRNWDQPADPDRCPENHALEQWLESMIAQGKRPHFAIDFHNDEGGNLHISRPNVDLENYLAHMKRFEELLRQHTWFTEGSTGGSFRNPGTLGEGFLERFGVNACIQELNANVIAGLDNAPPTRERWEQFGRDLTKVFHYYFEP